MTTAFVFACGAGALAQRSRVLIGTGAEHGFEVDRHDLLGSQFRVVVTLRLNDQARRWLVIAFGVDGLCLLAAW